MLTRREVLGSAAALSGTLVLGAETLLAQQQSPPATNPAAPPPGPAGPYTLPPLPYGYADLEPFIDAETMKLHHDKHHQAYVDGANAALADLDKIRRAGGDEIKRVRAVSDALQFNLSGHNLHSMFWQNMKKEGGGEPPPESEIGRMIVRDFGGFAAFAGQFQAAAMQVQGSGWGLLCFEPISQRLIVTQVEKQQNSTVWAIPLLGCDVWEHAYYLKYQNRRADYIKAFMNVINWADVDQRLRMAVKTAA